MVLIERKKWIWLTVVTLFLSFGISFGQDTLPSFSATIRPGKKILISWTNPYGNKIRQLSIQRSTDSLRLFKTIMTLPDPTVFQNGYVDIKNTDSARFYRLYILLDSGRYIFSSSKKAHTYIPRKIPSERKKETETVITDKDFIPAEIQSPKTGKEDPGEMQKLLKKNPVKQNNKAILVKPERFYAINRADTLLGYISEKVLKQFRDSLTLHSKDTLLRIVNDTIYIRPYIPKEVYKPSIFVFADKTGLLHIELPDAPKKKYKVSFFEEDKALLFEINHIKDPILLLDKSNFQHAGWFFFELFEEGRLIEKNRFFISKDF